MDTAGYVHFQNSSGTLTFEQACRGNGPTMVETINRCESSPSPRTTGWVTTCEPEAWLRTTGGTNTNTSSLFSQRRGRILCREAWQGSSSRSFISKWEKRMLQGWWLAGISHGRKALANFSHFSLIFHWPNYSLLLPCPEPALAYGAEFTLSSGCLSWHESRVTRRSR